MCFNVKKKKKEYWNLYRHRTTDFLWGSLLLVQCYFYIFNNTKWLHRKGNTVPSQLPWRSFLSCSVPVFSSFVLNIWKTRNFHGQWPQWPTSIQTMFTEPVRPCLKFMHFFTYWIPKTAFNGDKHGFKTPLTHGIQTAFNKSGERLTEDLPRIIQFTYI